MHPRFLAKSVRFASVLALAAAFAPAAFGELSIDTYPQVLVAGEGDNITFSCDREDLLDALGENYVAYTATLRVLTTNAIPSPSTVMKLQKVDENGNPTGAAGSSVTVNMYIISNGQIVGIPSGTVYVTGAMPGVAVISCTINGAQVSPQNVQIEVVAPDDIKFRQTKTGEIVNNIVVPESDLRNSASFYLDFGYNLPDAINFTVMNDAPAGTVDAPPSFRVTKGVSDYQYRFTALDGDQNITFKFTGDKVYTKPMELVVSVTNVPPVLGSPSGTEDNPTPRTALQGSPTSFDARASDVSADATAMKYYWYQNGAQLYFDGNDNVVARNASTRDYSLSDTIAVVFDADGILSVMAQDKDGGISRLGYWEVTLADSSTIKFTDEFTSAAITAGGGVGKAVFYTSATATDFKDAAQNSWRVDGNQFYAEKPVSVRAVPVPKDVVVNGVTIPDVPSYPFGWFVDDDSIATPSDLYVPNDSTIPISITAPSAGSAATVRYIATNPYLGYIDEVSNTLLDDFGDLDQDGLSDAWESFYFDLDEEQNPPSSTAWNTLAVAIGNGKYGMYGTSKNSSEEGESTDTPDNDRLPTKLVETIQNVWKDDPYYVAGTGNLVRVYAYPLGGSYVNYGTFVEDVTDLVFHGDLVMPNFEEATGTTKVDSSTKPYFTNIEEFRGLEQASQARSASWGSPNFVRVGYPGRLTGANKNLRGNCPGTDPTVNDTDGDGMTDGWEYYFWSTILYENKPEYWRAYDPTFKLYPTLDPLGTADFRAAGIPLLRQTVADTNVVEYEEGLFLRYPEEEFQPWIIRSDCYYGSPKPSGTGTNAVHRLAHAPVSHVEYVDGSYDLVGNAVVFVPVATNAAVEFKMGGLEVFTRSGFVDALGRGKLFYDPNQGDGAASGRDLREIDGAYVDFFTGDFYLPGYDYFEEKAPAAAALVGSRDATLSARYRTMNGLFPKQWLLNKFDPNDALALGSGANIAKIVSDAGYNPSLWDAESDLDNDGIPDIDEYYLGTNPMHWDTDNDGMPDGWELIFGLDPHDPADAASNPDGDSMYYTGPYRHVDAFIYDYVNQTYWNGQASLGFVPGAATLSSADDSIVLGVVRPDGVVAAPFTSREEFYVQKWMIGKDGTYPSFTEAVYPAMWQFSYNGKQFAYKGTDPRNDDTDEDRIPDGWEFYAGSPSRPLLDTVSASTETSSETDSLYLRAIDLVDYVYNHVFGKPFCPNEFRNDPDEDGLNWLQEFENWNTYNRRAVQVAAGAYSADSVSSYHDADWYKPAAEDWTNKHYPTSPWLADTDGDGVPDGAEYKEKIYEKGGIDLNGDRDRLVNLDPCSADTDKDRLPDGWKVVAGLYDGVNATFNPASTNSLFSPYGPYGDPDGDGLPNYQEYLTGAVYAWRYDKWYDPADESLWMPDEEMTAEAIQSAAAADSRVAAAFSADEDAFPYGKSVHFRKYRASDFFRPAASPVSLAKGKAVVERIEKRWQGEITHRYVFGNAAAGVEPGEKTVSGWDRTHSPTMGDVESGATVSTNANWYQRAWAILHDPEKRYVLEIDPSSGLDAAYDTAFIAADEVKTLETFMDSLLHASPDFSYGCVPAAWEDRSANGVANENVRSVRYLDPYVGTIEWSFMPNNYFGIGGFPGTMPRNSDTDNDGMDDYWEIFHGLNPTYGGSWAGGAGAALNADRADKHPWGDGSVDEWIMGSGYERVRNRTATGAGLLPVTRAKSAFKFDEVSADGSSTNVWYVASAAHFDYMKRPWLAGDPTADPDQDGLSNQEECYNEHLNDVLHHTDPSPYWFTDPSYAESYANLYYAVDEELSTKRWWWDADLVGTMADGPSYLFDFEVNEGFDTDNDNVSDREEISADNGLGVTDPLDLDSPYRRKALYLDGHAAARTRNPFFHGKWSLTSYTVEFWVRPEELPAAGKRATLLQRPVFMPVDDSSGARRYQIRHTFLVELDDLGRIYAQVDNDARETVSSAVQVSSARLVPGIWSHVAVVMDSVNDRFTLYVDGNFSGEKVAGLKPCTGILSGSEYLLSGVESGNKIENYRYYDYSPAPIVIGAFDNNPWGVVAGPRETVPWGLPHLETQSEPDFDPDRYFTGWIDEVRIWDRARSHSEIVAAKDKRFRKEDIEKINRARFAWEMKGWSQGQVGENVLATTQSDIPQALLYHYSFDNLPDVLPSADRTVRYPELFSADAGSSPAGWNDDTVSRYRPVPFWTAPSWYPLASERVASLAPWWATAAARSTVYTDFSYVPFIENTVAHMPQGAPYDMLGLVPNYDESTWTVTSYRRRGALDWVSDAYANARGYTNSTGQAQTVVPANLPASGSTDVQLAQVKNTMNPYGMIYRTALNAANEVHPAAFPGEIDACGVYYGVPVLSDMLPLMDAVADIDVELWDGLGRGTAIESVDTDGDGLPDWWEIAHGLDPNDATGDNGPYGDPDGDGLSNLGEYLAGMDPFNSDTDSDGYSDYFSRADGQSLTWGELFDDGDGIPDAWEVAYGLDPDRYDAGEDKDSDGWTNYEEYMAGTDPTRADNYPEPKFNVTFDYNGKYAEQGRLYVYSYGEKRTSRPYTLDAYFNGEPISGTNYWGGDWDSRYYGSKKEIGSFDDAYEGTVVVGNSTISTKAVKLDSADISTADPASITVNHYDSGRVTYTATSWSLSSDYLQFTDDDNNLLLLDYRSGVLHLLHRDDDWIYGDFAIEYTVAPSAYPLTIYEMDRDNSLRAGQHMVSGYNRFFGWLDLNENAEYDVGEPAGVSQQRPTLVSWDAVDAEIALTDELWGFPRVSWGDADAAGLDPDHYEVTFQYQVGTVTNELSGAAGDGDFDGLDDWAEGKAGTDSADPDTGDTGYSDYYKIDSATGLTYGELYDDGDGMPNAWERAVSVGRPVSLDPDRYDATEDPDLDGWSNWEEYMAGTDPTDASEFPVPKLEFTFDYAGSVTNSGNIVVQSYSSKTSGTGFGGKPDGVFQTAGAIHYGTSVIDGSETAFIFGSERPVNTYQGYKVASATISYEVIGEGGTNTWVTAEVPHSSDEYGYITTEDGTGTFGVIWENGTVFATGSCVGTRYRLDVVIDGYNFPIVEHDFIRRKGTHLVSGWNRFFGFIDSNRNGEYDVGEPAGISTRRPSLASYDTAQATIPLTDGLFGFPRFSWPTNNASENGYYTVVIWRRVQGTGFDTKVAEVKVSKPRNYFHEGDLVTAGINGLPFGSAKSASFYWVVYDGTDTSRETGRVIWPDVNTDNSEVSVSYNYEGASSDDNTGSYFVNADTGRRTMQAIYPKDGETVHGPLVDFRWAMDHRNEGVTITVKNLDTGTTHIGSLVVPIPRRHGVAADGRMPVEYAGYYSACPQLEGNSSLNPLPSGRYSYTITERIDGATFTPQSVSGTFVLENDDAGQGRSAIKGDVYYFGRALNGGSFPASVKIQAFALPEGAASGAAPSGNPVAQATVSAPGEFTLHGLADGTYAVFAFLDQNANTRADEWETQGYGVLAGTASPVFYGTPAPLVVSGGDLEGVSIVLHPRDTDNDGLDDDWEWKKSGDLTTKNGSAADLAAFAADPIGAAVGTPYFYPAGVDPDEVVGSLGLDVRPETFYKTFYIPAPRTFLHEGDFEDAGFFGFPMGLATNSLVRWNAFAVSPKNGTSVVGAGSFVEYAGPKGSRKTMEIGYPDQCTAVLGTDVEFEWKMDYRNAGVAFKIERLGDDLCQKDASGEIVLDENGKPKLLPYAPTDGSEWETVFDGIVPFPVCHGSTAGADYRFSAKPQLEDGRKCVPFEAGYYRYTITERPMTDAYAPQSVEGRFFVVASGDVQSDRYGHYAHTASGTVEYYGKAGGGLLEDTLVSPADMTVVANLDGSTSSLDFEYDGDVARGSMVLELLDPEGNVVDRFSDRATSVPSEGRFYAEVATCAWSGSIVYPDEELGGVASVHVEFDIGAPLPAAGSTLRMGMKAFKRKIVVQAFKLPDNASTCVSVSGHPVAEIEMESKGAFKFEGLEPGKYAFRAFLDSNENSVPDEWETQGVAVKTGTASPVLDSSAEPIEIVSDVNNLLIVLHDRDTDNDLLPDAWEYEMFGDVSAHGGRDADPSDDTGLLMLWQTYADGPLDADPRTPDSDLDGLTDAMEIMITRTDTEKRDTDGDGVGDLEEFLSGSDPLDPSVAIPYATPALAFDEDGAPYVDCPYPALPRGVVLTYVLQRKASLDDPEWEDVDEFEVAATDAEPVAVADGVTLAAIPAGTGRMTPADKLDTLDWKSGFFRVRVFADYGKMVENGDGTCSFWAWTRSGEFAEVARGEGTLVRDADGAWSFVDEVTRKPGRLVHLDDGSWKFIRY